MTTATEVLETIRQTMVAVGEVNPDEVTAQSRFADFRLDSVEVMEVVSRVETHYSVEIDEVELSRINTLRELAKAFEKRLKAS